MATTPQRLTALTLCALGLAGCNWQKQASSSHFFADMYAQEQFFFRMGQGNLYVPEPAMMDKLDLDDAVLLRKYQQDPPAFTEKLKQAKVDINTVLVRPNPVNIRVLALQEGNPATLWTL